MGLRHAVPAATRVRPDDGYSLLEVIVATALIGTVVAAVTSFLVSATRTTNLSGGQQRAVQLASEGIEAARGVPVDTLRTALTASGGNWAPPVSAGMPDPRRPAYKGQVFARTWSVVRCWQQPAGGSCGAQTAGSLPFLRISVTVTWADRDCRANSCSFTTSSLVSDAPTEPLFAP